MSWNDSGQSTELHSGMNFAPGTLRMIDLYARGIINCGRK